MLTEQDAQNQIKELEKELGVSPTTLTEGDAQSERVERKGDDEGASSISPH